MATGACGINCDVCRLNLLGLCTTCGSGTGKEAQVKLAAQERVLGQTCAILSCCSMNRNGHCMRDCAQFPCQNYTLSSYPFGPAFLDMQTRRRRDWVPRHDPLGRPVEIPDDLWQALDRRDIPQLKALTLAESDDLNRLVFPFTDMTLAVDVQARQIFSLEPDKRSVPLDIPLLTLVVLTYFARVDRLFPMGKDLISTSDMGGNYFSGQQGLRIAPLFRRFFGDREMLARSAAAIGGRPMDLTEDAWAVYPFPRLALYYLFRDMDGEYEPGLSILFDRSIQDIFTPPLVWELVNLTNARFLSV